MQLLTSACLVSLIANKYTRLHKNYLFVLPIPKLPFCSSLYFTQNYLLVFPFASPKNYLFVLPFTSPKNYLFVFPFPSLHPETFFLYFPSLQSQTTFLYFPP